MRKYKVKILDRRLIAQNTVVLVLTKPKGFNFLSGQYLDLIIPRKPDLEYYETGRTFTIASSPQEGNLVVIYRDRDSGFKNTIRELKVGSDLFIEGPFGRFVIGSESVSVMLAGGVGVAPFLSMIKDQLFKKSARKIMLFYSNHSKDEAAFLAELQSLADDNPQFTLVPTLTQKNLIDTGWPGEYGYISSVMIKKYLFEFSSAVFYICGTPDMVFDLRIMISQLGIKSANIRTESFDGY